MCVGPEIQQFQTIKLFSVTVTNILPYQGIDQKITIGAIGPNWESEHQHVQMQLGGLGGTLTSLGSPPITLNDILEKFIFHPSNDKIRKTYESDQKFSFQQVTEEHVQQVILSIDGSKATPVADIPADML